MLSHTRAHHPFHTHQFDPAKVVITILVMLLFLVFLFLFLTLTAPPAQGQNRVPATAAQAAKMPQFASKLAHPMRMAGPDNASRLPNQQRASYRNRNDAHKRYDRIGPLDSFDIYDNGPTNGTVDAWTINFGFIVSNTFTLQQANNPTGMNFAAWLFPGDILESAELSITSSEFGGTTYFDGVVNFTQSDCVTNQLGFLICTESGTFPNVNLNAGTYWMNLQNAVVNTGDPVYWDENSGPSFASENSVGTIPSESFTVLSGTSTTSSRPVDCRYQVEQGEFSFIHSFTGGDDGAVPSNVVRDQYGNLFGANQVSGNNGPGSLFKLIQQGSTWLEQTLYDFVGWDNGGSPGNVLLGPNQRLYGSAWGGLPQCDGVYCGVIFEAAPPSRVCRTAMCTWDESPIHTFTGGDDPSGQIFGADSNGNLYGIQGNNIFEMTKSSGQWIKSTIFTFPGGTGGSGPRDALWGSDGSIYGLASGTFGDIIFQLTQAGQGWQEQVLHIFARNIAFSPPNSLVRDSAGNLYGIGYTYVPDIDQGEALVYELPLHSRTVDVLAVLYNRFSWSRARANLGVVDAAGNVYGAQTIWVSECQDGWEDCFLYSEIFRVNRGGSATMVQLGNGYAYMTGGSASDAQGNIYGVSMCGDYRVGAVWELSP